MRPASRFFSKITSNGNLAFVIVVLASYVSVITSLIASKRPFPFWKIELLVAFAIAYLILGTYGFAICRRRGTRAALISYFAFQLALAASLIWLRGLSDELSLILFPLAAQSALVLPPRWMVAVCVLVYTNLMLPLIIRGRLRDAIAMALVYGTGIVVVVVFSGVAASERAARAELAEANRRLREHAAQVEELATTKERNRLAREIHDSLGHYLTVVNVQIGAARAMIDRDQERALNHLSKAQSLTQEGLAEIRRSVASLRAASIESHPLAESLAQMTEQLNTTATKSTFEIVGATRPISPEAELTFYKSAQEALTNVGKHAHAGNVMVTLDYTEPSFVRLIVQDDGMGTSNCEEGFGLLGVRERAQLLGGNVCTTSEAGKGFEIEVELPG